MRWLTLILIVSSLALVVSIGLAIHSFMMLLSLEASVKVRHSYVRIDDSTAIVTFTLSSPREGRYSYAVSCNSSEQPFLWFNDGSIWAGGSFTYTLYLKLEPCRVLAVNVKIWWEGKLIDDVTHYARFEG